jgi:hypothetical protein
MKFNRLAVSLAVRLAAAVGVCGATAAPAHAYDLPRGESEALGDCQAAFAAPLFRKTTDPATGADLFVDAVWYAIAGVKTRPDGEIMTVLGSAFDNIAQGRKAVIDDAANVRRACIARWPASGQRAGGVALPGDEFKAATTCLALAAMINGLIETVDAPVLLGRSKRVISRVSARLSDDDFAAQGYSTDPQIVGLLGRRIVESHVIGNPRDVLLACDNAL